MAEPDYSITVMVGGKKITSMAESSPPGIDVADQEGSGPFLLTTYTKGGEKHVKRFATEEERRRVQNHLERGLQASADAAFDLSHDESAVSGDA